MASKFFMHWDAINSYVRLNIVNQGPIVLPVKQTFSNQYKVEKEFTKNTHVTSFTLVENDLDLYEQDINCLYPVNDKLTILLDNPFVIEMY